MNPEQPAERSNAAALRAPSWSWMMQALAGIGMSGVTDAQITRSRSPGPTPEARRASRAARLAKNDIGSSSRAIRRSRIPVRVVIQSSEVSTILSRSALVRILSGRHDPVPRMTARRPVRAMSFPRRRGRGAGDLGARLARRDPRDLVVNPIVDAIPIEVEGYPHRVLDGARRRASVADDGGAAHAQKRHAAVL